MNGYEKRVKELLRQHGWQKTDKGKGSHQVWEKGRRSVTVNNECKSRHTANGIMKDAGISHKF